MFCQGRFWLIWSGLIFGGVYHLVVELTVLAAAASLPKADFGASSVGDSVEAIVEGGSGGGIFLGGSVFGGGCFVGVLFCHLRP